MLEEIEEIKKKYTWKTFSARNIYQTTRRFEKLNFIENVNKEHRINHDVEVSVIFDLEELDDLIRFCDVKLKNKEKSYTKHMQSLEESLNNPNMIYFQIRSQNDELQGYFSLVVAKNKDGKEILFEDQILSKDSKLYHRPEVYHPDLKTIIALTLEDLKLTDSSYMFIPFNKLDHIKGKRLEVTTKDGFVPYCGLFDEEFYSGYNEYSLWPSFIRTDELLTKARKKDRVFETETSLETSLQGASLQY